MLIGTANPKNNQNSVGQNASEKTTPRIKEELNLLLLLRYFSILYDKELPNEPLKWITPRIYRPIRITKGPINFLVNLNTGIEACCNWILNTAIKIPYNKNITSLPAIYHKVLSIIFFLSFGSFERYPTAPKLVVIWQGAVEPKTPSKNTDIIGILVSLLNSIKGVLILWLKILRIW